MKTIEKTMHQLLNEKGQALYTATRDGHSRVHIFLLRVHFDQLMFVETAIIIKKEFQYEKTLF